MKAKAILTTSVGGLLLFGLSFLLNAQWTIGLFDLTLDQPGIVMTQLLGALVVSFAVLNGLARNVTVYEDARPVLVANFVMNGLGFAILLFQKLNGFGNIWVWVPITLYLLFALGFGYCLLTPETVETRIRRVQHT